MLNESVLEALSERLVQRIETLNTFTLETIGKQIGRIGTLTPSSAYKLINTLKYGGSLDNIALKLAEITNLNVNDIYNIFEEVAKIDLNFAKRFYDFKGINFIPYEQNIALQQQVQAIAKITADNYINLSNTLAFARKDKFGKVFYTSISKTYQDTLDNAILSISQGKSTYQQQMYQTIKELGASGIRTVDYTTNYSRRLDSAVRMNILDGMRNLHNEVQKIIGEDIDYDGIEISVHDHSAPDHEPIQGHQFTLEEYEKLQSERDFQDVNGVQFNAIERGISELNCYHYIFSIVLGVSKPLYTEEQLKDKIKENNGYFTFDDKPYTIYEGTQLQRKLETSIRKQKDVKNIALVSGNNELVSESNLKIRQLTKKYNDLSKISGLPTKKDRLVSIRL